MERNRNNRGPEEPLSSSNNAERRSTVPNDLPDTAEDQQKLAPEETTIDLPDVKDIPGQEFIHAPAVGMMADTTISSDDEEGRGILDDDDAEEDDDASFDVRPDERRALEDTEYLPTADEDNLRRARLDNVDFEGDPLNEKGFGEELSGADLDMEDSTDETNTDSMGQGDEENKLYSLGSDNNDNATEGTP